MYTMTLLNINKVLNVGPGIWSDSMLSTYAESLMRRPSEERPFASCILSQGTVVCCSQCVADDWRWITPGKIDFRPVTTARVPPAVRDVVSQAVWYTVTAPYSGTEDDPILIREIETLSSVDKFRWTDYVRYYKGDPRLDKFDYLGDNLSEFTCSEMLRCDRFRPIVSAIVFSDGCHWQWGNDGEFRLRGTFGCDQPKVAGRGR